MIISIICINNKYLNSIIIFDNYLSSISSIIQSDIKVEKLDCFMIQYKVQRRFELADMRDVV